MFMMPKLAAAADRELTHEPSGLHGRSLRAHDEVRAAFEAGNPDGAIGADVLVAALTIAAYCESGSVQR